MSQCRALSFQHRTTKNMEQIRIFNLAIFPVTYQPSFYRQVLERDEKWSLLAYMHDVLIGSILCRVEDEHRLYIMTLGVLPPYRRLRLGHLLVEKMLEVAREDGKIDAVTLNVQETNEAAIEFYTKGFGFEQSGLLKNYYHGIVPPNAYTLCKRLRPPKEGPGAAPVQGVSEAEKPSV